MKNPSTRLSHIEINVSDYPKSIRFYDMILFPLGWERLVCTTDCTTYSDGFLKLILSPVEEKFKEAGFHRKRIGLNHLALYAFSQKEVDSYYKDVLLANNISSLYQEGPDGDDEYYSVLFEDPDRMKIEITYAPCYCEKESWPNNIESNFDPYTLKNTPLKITSSINPTDIDKVMSIVATFGANAENIIKIRDYIKNELTELADNRILYFLEDVDPVAMVQLILKNADNRPELANGKDIAHIHALQVSKLHHRQGYGFKLMQLLELEAIARGVNILTLGVDSDNEKALNLYKKLNYSLMETLEGRTPEVQLHYLQKRLK